MPTYFPYTLLASTSGNNKIPGAVNPEEGFNDTNIVTLTDYNNLKAKFKNWDSSVLNLLNYVQKPGNSWQLKSGHSSGQVLMTLANGNYLSLYAETRSYGLYVGVNFYYQNGTLFKQVANVIYNSDTTEANALCFNIFIGVKNSHTALTYAPTVLKLSDPTHVYSSLDLYSGMESGAEYTTFFGNAFPPANVWQSWERIAGNNGQFSANLTRIKESVISDADPTAYKVFTAGDFDEITPQSSIWNIYLNALIGEEYTVAYSGNNKATLTVTNHGTNANIKIFTFKFYFGATETPFLTTQEEVVVSGETPAIIKHNYYMSFLYDPNENVAVFYPIGYMPNGPVIYAHQVTAAVSDLTMQNLYTWLNASSGSPTGSGPYDTGTTDNGGTPSGSGHQDPMPTIHTPVLSGAASGMFTIYCPDDTQLGNIASFLWSDSVLDNFKKYFNNFSDNIIALYVLPYKPANLPTKAFTVGKLQSETITSVEYVTTRFVSVPMGEITVGTRWDSYLDFEPYTKFSIYLPGIGVQALSADDIICPPNNDESLPIARGSKLSLEYVLDLMTGNVAAYIKINGQIRYQFTGKVGYSIPITGANYSALVQGYVMATAGLIGTLATGGTAAPFAASAGAAGIINAMKPDVYRGGNLSGDSSSMCLDYPYLIRRRPNKPYLNEQEIYTGFPSYKSGTLSEFSGFTQVLDAHIEGISCTEAERAEILNLLKGGVIL